MIRSPDVAVVIPAYNEQELLPRALAALNNCLIYMTGGIIQHASNLGVNIVVVDNGSTDLTAEVSRVMGTVLLKETTKGIPFARNKGLNNIPESVRVVLTTDADGVVSPDWIEKHLRAYEESGIVYTYGSRIFKVDDKATLYQRISLLIYNVATILIHRLENRIGSHVCGACNAGYLKDRALEVGGYDPRHATGGDIELMYRILKDGRRAKEVNAPVLTSARRKLKVGIFKNGWRKLCRNFLALFKKSDAFVSAEYEDFR